jgi:acylphosphatase
MTGTTVRWKLVATGKVQLVGYRERVALEAEKRGIAGTVENDDADERRVLIEAQGPDSALEAFRQAISTPEDRSVPKSVVRVQELPADPSLVEFRVKRSEVHLETLERMEYAGVALGKLDATSKRGFEGVDQRLQQGFDGVNQGLRRGFGRVDQGLGRIEKKIHRGNSATAALYKDTTQFHRNLGLAVRTMDAKYGTIGKTLVKIDKDLQAQTKALLLLVKTMANGSPRVGSTNQATNSSRRSKR